MNKAEYIAALRREIQALSEDEREEAILYYTEYFDDAGPEKEAEVIAELGTPEELGRYILTKFSCVPEKAGRPRSGTGKRPTDTYAGTQPDGMSAGIKVLLIIITFPVWFPVITAVFSVMFGLFVAALAVGCSIFIAACAVLIAGIFTGVSGFATAFTAPLSGILVIGTGLMLAGAGLIFTVFGIWVCTKCVPAIIRGFVSLCRMPFNRRKENA